MIARSTNGLFQIGALLCAGVALVALRGEAGEVHGQDDLEARVEALEQAAVKLGAANAELAEGFGLNRALIDETIAYLEAQSKSAQALTETLAESEALGYTAGINFESRELLLAGWRARLKAIQKDLPGVEQKAPAKKPDDKVEVIGGGMSRR
jgi:hypothetical protein